jgi:hypothetical protein
MRGRENQLVVLLVVSAIALGIAASSTLPVDQALTADSSRLVSIEPLAEMGEMCLWEPVSAKSVASSEGNNLFAAFADKPVYAASQDSAGTTDLARPPVRNILDTDPIYSAVTVDTRLN